jgi:hypothetical protein
MTAKTRGIIFSFFMLTSFACTNIMLGHAQTTNNIPQSTMGQSSDIQLSKETPAITRQPEYTKIITITPTNSPIVAIPFTWITVSEKSGSVKEIIINEVGKANKFGQKPFVFITASWCIHCRALKESMNDKRMIDAFTGTYIIEIDKDIWEQQLSKIKIFVRGIPAFIGVNSEGMSTGKSVTGAVWDDDIPENMAPPLKAFFQSN